MNHKSFVQALMTIAFASLNDDARAEHRTAITQAGSVISIT